MNFDPALGSRPDAICILPVGPKNGHQRGTQVEHPSRWDVHLIEVKKRSSESVPHSDFVLILFLIF